MSIDMYSEKTIEATTLIKQVTGLDWFYALDTNSQETLERFIACMDKVKADILASLPAPVAPLTADTDKLREAILGLTLDIEPTIFAGWTLAEQNAYCKGFHQAQQAASELLPITAGQAPVREVPGWQLVPIEPTEDMEVALLEEWFSKKRGIDDSVADVYSAVLAAAPDAPIAKEIPDGWKLVPIEPTHNMYKAAADADDKACVGGSHHGADVSTLWAAMVDAAPLPAAPVQTEPKP